MEYNIYYWFGCSCCNCLCCWGHVFKKCGDCQSSSAVTAVMMTKKQQQNGNKKGIVWYLIGHNRQERLRRYNRYWKNWGKVFVWGNVAQYWMHIQRRGGYRGGWQRGGTLSLLDWPCSLISGWCGDMLLIDQPDRGGGRNTLLVAEAE